MRYATLLVAFAALISASRDAAAQYAPSCVVSTSGGVIRGIMVDDTGYGVADAHVHAGRCRTTTDELGRFILHGVWPRGVVVHGHTLEFATRVSRLALHEGDTASVELRLVTNPGPIHWCRADPQCAEILDGELPTLQNDSLDLRVAAWTTLIALASRGAMSPYACVPDESEAVLTALQARYPTVVHADECEGPSISARANVRHAATGTRAFKSSISLVELIGPGRAEVYLSALFGPRSGTEWACRFERTDRWRATGCEAIGAA